ncbi:MAG: DUF1176 domain-containing protein [Proteobacteria bacterium]|nr:DUF1176 domain-containing protein [Pseudomonadota bacterium]
MAGKFLNGLVVGCALALAAPAMAATPPEATYREIKDWIVGCDNLHACKAKAAPDELLSDRNDVSGGYLAITREPGPQGALVVSTEGEGDYKPGRMQLDGKPLSAPWKEGPDDSFVLRGDDAARFIQTIRSGKALTFEAGEGVSLSGLTAALLVMDEAQGRLGNETALVRKGTAPAATVPAAKAAPIIVSRPSSEPLPNAQAFAAAVRRTHAKALEANACDATRAQYDEAYPLNHAEALVVLACGMGAYQGWDIAFRAPRADPARARLLILPTLPQLDAKARNTGAYTEGEWDPKRAQFGEVGKGRGLADCGESVTWAFDGSEFHLSHLYWQERCAGGPPGDWLTLWRADVRPNGVKLPE